MAKQISVQESVYEKLDIIRSAKSKLLSFNTLLELLADEKLKYAKSDVIKNLLAMKMSEMFIFEVFRAGLTRHYDDQYADAIRNIIVGKFEVAISIIQGLIDPDQEKLR